VHARSNDGARGASLAAQVASQTLALSYSGAVSRAGNRHAAADFKAFAATGRPGHALALDEVGSTAYDTRNQQIGLALRDATQLLEVTLGWQDVPYQLYPNQRMDMLDNQQRRINLRYRGQFGWGTLEARVFRETVDHYMDFGADKQFTYGPNPPSTIVAPGMPMYTAGRTTGATLKAELPWGTQDLLRAGAEAQAYRLNDWWPPSPADLTGMVSAPGVPATSGGMAPDTFWNIRDGRRDRVGLYAEWERQWNPQWLHLLGLRSDRVTSDTGNVQGYNTVMAGYAASAAAFNARDHHRRDTHLDLTALARYTPAETTALEIGYARKSRSPNLYERYAWSQNSMALIMNNFVGDGNGYLGNLDLKPEVAHTLSASAEWHEAAPQGRALKATLYTTYVQDFIDAVRCAGSGMMMNALCSGATNATATGKFVNLQYANQSAHLAGLDLSGHLPLADNAWGRWALDGVLTLSHARNGVTGDAPYNTLPRQGRLTLSHALAGWDSGLELEMVGAKDRVSAVRNELSTAGYALLNLRVGHRWERLRVDLGIDNLLDRAYQLPLGGAYVGQGMTMSSNGVPWGIAVPGTGRSVYARMSLTF
jgi:iron complex outermembrane receptor protein